MPHNNPAEHLTFRNDYKQSFPRQRNWWLWTAPVSTSQTILHSKSYVVLIMIRFVFNCSYPTVGINWGTHVPWDVSLQQPRHLCHHTHTLSPTGLPNRLWVWERKVSSYDQEPPLYLWSSRWRGFRKNLFSKNGLRVEVVIQVTQKKQKKPGELHSCGCSESRLDSKF